MTRYMTQPVLRCCRYCTNRSIVDYYRRHHSWAALGWGKGTAVPML